MTRKLELTYPGFGVDSGLAQAFLDDQQHQAAVVEHPDNQGTSVTNAVEQVYEAISKHMGVRPQLWTIAPWDPSREWGIFKVEFDRARRPSWVRASESDLPPVAREAFSWAKNAYRNAA